MKMKRHTSQILTLCMIMAIGPVLAQHEPPKPPDITLEMEIPPPPTSLPPRPPDHILFHIVTQYLPKPNIGNEIGNRMSSLGYFIDAEICGFSGTVITDKIKGWLCFEKLGWVYLEGYSKHELELVLNSPEMGWLMFTISATQQQTFYSYAKDQWLYFQKDNASKDFYYYMADKNRWEKLKF
jgi:hypothetical protein